jgi:hypothetical protein
VFLTGLMSVLANALLLKEDVHKSIQELLEHADIAITVDTYRHVVPEIRD